MKVAMINDCAFVGETLPKYLSSGIEKEHIKRSRGLWSKTFGIALRVLPAGADVYHAHYRARSILSQALREDAEYLPRALGYQIVFINRSDLDSSLPVERAFRNGRNLFRRLKSISARAFCARVLLFRHAMLKDV